MISLERRTGLPVFLKTDNTLASKGIKLPKPDARTFRQIKPVLLAGKTKLKKFYYMYRDVASNPLLRKYKVRFDITIIPHHKIGKEEIKTAGHYHAHIRGTNLTYPEVYQIIHGEALYIFQKKAGSKIADVVALEAKPGDVVIVPPNYGHITVNAAKKTLVMANLVYSKFKSQYKDIEKKHGAAYYVIETKRGIEFLENPSYGMVPRIRFSEKKAKGLKAPIYKDFMSNPKKYFFLFNPRHKITI